MCVDKIKDIMRFDKFNKVKKIEGKLVDIYCRLWLYLYLVDNKILIYWG